MTSTSHESHTWGSEAVVKANITIGKELREFEDLGKKLLSASKESAGKVRETHGHA